MENPDTEQNSINTTNSILRRPKTGYVQHTNPQHPNTDIRPETRAQKEIGMGKGGFSGFNYWQVYNELVWLTHIK
jgi:hypothetical protein